MAPPLTGQGLILDRPVSGQDLEIPMLTRVFLGAAVVLGLAAEANAVLMLILPAYWNLSVLVARAWRVPLA
jgi:hypothetical protein